MTCIWVLAIVAIAIAVYGAARISSGIFIRALCRMPRSKGVLLTFDDGPSADTTPALLDVLAKHSVKALFFSIGQKAEQHPELIKRIIAEGHTIGNHTYYHNPFYTFHSLKSIISELQRTHDILTNIGAQVCYFRPPLGITNQTIAWACHHMNYKVVGWSIRSFDTRNEPREVVLRRIDRQLSDGSIILLHDRIDGAAQLADDVIKAIKNKGLAIAQPDDIKQ